MKKVTQNIRISIVLLIAVLGLTFACASYPTLPENDFKQLEQAFRHNNLDHIKTIYENNKKEFSHYDEYYYIRKQSRVRSNTDLSSTYVGKRNLNFGYAFRIKDKYKCGKMDKIIEYLYGTGFRVSWFKDFETLIGNACYDSFRLLKKNLETEQYVYLAYTFSYKRFKDIFQEPDLDAYRRMVKLAGLFTDKLESECTDRYRESDTCRAADRVKNTMTLVHIITLDQWIKDDRKMMEQNAKMSAVNIKNRYCEIAELVYNCKKTCPKSADKTASIEDNGLLYSVTPAHTIEDATALLKKYNKLYRKQTGKKLDRNMCK
ncbi:MAG TPA: hypothetical protein PKW95_21545 [bacterium]|nr:hypothetical protein [bacterium]